MSVNVFITAVRSGNVEEVDRLIRAGVDPSENASSAIRDASLLGYLNVVERLLADPRVDPTNNNNYTIKYASDRGHIAVVERLLQDPRVVSSLSPALLAQYRAQITKINIPHDKINALTLTPFRNGENIYSIPNGPNSNHRNVFKSAELDQYWGSRPKVHPLSRYVVPVEEIRKGKAKIVGGSRRRRQSKRRQSRRVSRSKKNL